METSSVRIQKQFLESLFSDIYVDKNRHIKMVIREGLT